MLTNIIERYAQWTSWRKLALGGVLFVSVMLFLQLYFLPLAEKVTGGLPLIDNHSGYTPAEAYQLLEGYGEQGRHFYNYIQIIDLFFPPLVGWFLSMAIITLISRAFPNRKPLWRVGLYPFLIPVFDYAENIGVFLLLRSVDSPIPFLARYTLLMHHVKLFSICRVSH